MPTLATSIEDGIYYDIPFDEYLLWPVLSQSTLKEGRESMAHLKAAIDGERVKEVTDDMALGTAMHTAFLEPELAAGKTVLWKGGTRRGGAWDEFEAEHAGKVILTPVMNTQLIGMVRSLRLHPFVKQWRNQIEATEVSIVGEVCGVQMKSRCDAVTPEPLVDLKKVRSTRPEKIMRTVLEFGYHIQAWIYREQFGRERFVILCVEDKPPHDVVPFELSPAMLRFGGKLAAELLEQYQNCLASGVWPGRADSVVQLEAPNWLNPETGITIGDDSAFDEED